MCGGCQGVGGASGALPQLVVLAEQVFVGEGISGRSLGRGGRCSSVPRPRLPRHKRFFWHHSHMWKTQCFGLYGEGTKIAQRINLGAVKSYDRALPLSTENATRWYWMSKTLHS